MQTLILGRPAPATPLATHSRVPPSHALQDRDSVAAHYLGCLAERQARERALAASFFQHLPTR
jgi:hypothetical protein